MTDRWAAGEVAKASGAFSLALLVPLEPAGLMKRDAGGHLQWMPFSGSHSNCLGVGVGG